MEVSIMLGIFMLGTILGSFYNVVAYRVTKGESILFPSSHCPKCNHALAPWELIPIFSFLLQRGRCTSCKSKISIFYPIAEILCGYLFLQSYLSFGLSLDLIIALTFVSMIIIVTLSDYYYMVIEDVILIIFGILLLIEIFIIHGYSSFITSIISGLISGIFMLLIKLLGDFIFKKESMGYGDIKLLVIFGIVLQPINSILTIFLSSFIAFPFALITLKSKKNHEIPYGPFLCAAALSLYFTHFNIDIITSLF